MYIGDLDTALHFFHSYSSWHTLSVENLINQRNAIKDPSSNVSASEDLFLTIVQVHILSVCMTVSG